MLFRITLVIIAFLVVVPSHLKAQSQTVIVYPASYGVIEKDDSLNGNNGGYYFNLTSPGKIGRQDDQTFRRYYRTRLSFSFSQIPFGARINSCSLYVVISNYASDHVTDKAKIIKLDRGYPDAQFWSKFDNPGTVYYGDRQYGQTYGYLPTSYVLTGDVQTGVNTSSPNNDLTVGVLSQNEGSNGSTADISTIYMTVNYSPRVAVTIQNSFSGGKVEIDGSVPLKDSPWYSWSSSHSNQPIWYAGDAHSIRAYSQSLPNQTATYPFLGTWTCSTGEHKTQSTDNTPVPISPTVDCTWQANFGSPSVIVTVDQKLNNGTSVGSIGIWESGSDFMSYTVPKAFYFPLSSSQTLRGEQNILSGQKYNKWMMNTSVDPDVTNHQSFNITQNFVTNLISQLQLTTEGSTIKVDLLDAPGNYSGAVQFKDPWLIDSTDAAHNSKPLNRGMNALYKNRTAPFSPDTATPFGSDVYKGVFLNQYYTIPNNPYYSVSAPQTQTYLNGFTGYFQGWNTTNATLQQVGTNPSGYDQKAVVFNSANATVTAKYKAHLGSSFSTVTTNNSQRRMAVGGGTHIVYESAKAIWYTCYNGSTWSPEILVSNPGYVAKNPSITTLTDQTNWYVDVVWEELDPVDTNAHSVYYRRETITTSSQSWGSFKYLGYSTYKMDASPVVEAFASYPPGRSRLEIRLTRTSRTQDASRAFR